MLQVRMNRLQLPVGGQRITSLLDAATQQKRSFQMFSALAMILSYRTTGGLTFNGFTGL